MNGDRYLRPVESSKDINPNSSTLTKKKNVFISTKLK